MNVFLVRTIPHCRFDLQIEDLMNLSHDSKRRCAYNAGKKNHQLNNQTRRLTVIQSLPNARYSHFPHSEHVRQVSSNNVQPFLS